MVVPSGKKVELVSLVMEADCRDEKGFTQIIENNEQGEEKLKNNGQEEGGRVDGSGLSVEVEKEEKLQGREEVVFDANVGRDQVEENVGGDQEEEDVGGNQEEEEAAGQNSPFPPEVPLLHQVLRIPPGQSVPLAQPEEEEEELCEDGEALKVEAVVPGDVIVSKEEMLEARGPDLHENRQAKPDFGPDESQCDSKEMVNNSDDEEEEEDMILSSNFVDTLSEKSREEEVSSFLPPLTMQTPLKSWEVPRPLVTSTPATAPGTYYNTPQNDGIVLSVYHFWTGFKLIVSNTRSSFPIWLL